MGHFKSYKQAFGTMVKESDDFEPRGRKRDPGDGRERHEKKIDLFQ